MHTLVHTNALRMYTNIIIYHIQVHILPEVNRIKNAHELIFGIWYSDQIFLPLRPDEIITLHWTPKEKR